MKKTFSFSNLKLFSNFRLFSNLKLFKFFDKKGLGSLPRIFVSSVLIVTFFYISPTIINLIEKRNNEFQNNSKAVLAYTLNKENSIEGDNQILDEKDLLVDIFSLNDLDTDTVRLNASTIKQLFEDTNYTLSDVRKKIGKTCSTDFITK